MTATMVAAIWYALAVPGRGHVGPLPALTEEERDIASRLKNHVMAIASVPHNIEHYAALKLAASYIEQTLEELKYAVNRQPFTVAGREVKNIEVQRKGSIGPPLVVVGTHYDSFDDAPGANDNGTGVAAILELARLLKDWQPRNVGLRFVLFVNEEPPYYRTRDMVSWRYAKHLAELSEQVHGMISLETLGAYSDAPGSQEYPRPFSFILPSTANFVAFVGLPGSRAFHHEVLASFRKHCEFPSIGAVVPDEVAPGAGWSDHWSFRMSGYPAMMITDTALFRYPHYHLPSDTPDKVDYERLARVTKGLEHVLRDVVR